MDRAPDGPVIVIAGPTASGKSDAALAVAEEFGGAVINADSMQVYRELDVITARPRFPATVRVPHLLYGFLPASEACSVGQWLERAARAVDETRAMGRVPVVAGGTGLYLKALMEGLSAIPEPPIEAREEARSLHAELGGEAFRDRLAELDPTAAARLPAGDTQRLIRAYEVVLGTGRTLGDWQKEAPVVAPVTGPFLTIAIVPPRDRLYAAIDARFGRMVEEGGLDEVRRLVGLGLDPGLPAMKAVGVRELAAFLAGETTLEGAVESAQKASRNYAKRQFTWLRHQFDADLMIDAQYSESKKDEIFSFIRQFGLTAQS